MAAAEQCDLIAMASHGHRWLGDLIPGAPSMKSGTGPPS